MNRKTAAAPYSIHTTCPRVNAIADPAEMTERTPMQTLTQTIDALAAIRADIAELKNKEAAHRDFLIAAGITEAEGTLHRATVSTTYAQRIDWQTIAEKLGPSRQLIAAHTSRATEPTYTVRLSARKTT